MVDAITVGNSILDRAAKDNVDITPMKLQKLIYCLYKEYYKSTGRALFDERFEAWKYGPVLRSVYDAFKRYGSNVIKGMAVSADGNIYVVNSQNSVAFTRSFEKIWETYSEYDGIVLSAFTHRENTAWRKAIDQRKVYLLDADIVAEEDYVTN